MDKYIEIIRNRYEVMAPNVIKELEKRGFAGYFARDREEAKEMVPDMIPEGSVIGWGGSQTLDHMNLKPELKSEKYKAINRDNAKNAEEKHEYDRQILANADYYITSVNAMSEDGIMYNIDGNGNRVAATIFGPKKVIFLVGMNKIVKTREDAYSRARNIAAPVNGVKLNNGTPCAITGKCTDCHSEHCICSFIVEMRHSMVKDRIKVILIGEDVGF